MYVLKKINKQTVNFCDILFELFGIDHSHDGSLPYRSDASETCKLEKVTPECVPDGINLTMMLVTINIILIIGYLHYLRLIQYY